MLRGHKERTAVKPKINQKTNAERSRIQKSGYQNQGTKKKIERRKCCVSLQALFRKNPTAAAHSVLKEKYGVQASILCTDLADYWSPIFEEESVEDDSPFATINHTVTEMQDPITRWDVKIAFLGLKDGCPGRDGIRKRHLKEFSYDDLAVSLASPCIV